MATVYSLICWGGRTGKTVSLSASTDVVTLTNHGLRNGTKLWPSGTLPSELNVFTPVYARSTASNTFTLHTSAAGAIANTGQITFAGSSTYAAVVLKSDLVANAASALSPYGLSDLSRWGSSGSERVYDGLNSWYAARSAAASSLIEEYCELGETFVNRFTDQIIIAVRAGSWTIASKINGIRTSAYHAGVINDGFVAEWGTSNNVIIKTAVDRCTLDGFTCRASAGGANLICIDIQSSIAIVNKMMAIGYFVSTGWGIGLRGAAIEVSECVAMGSNLGFVPYNSYTAMRILNCFAWGNGTGIATNNPSSLLVEIYNTISVGNTTNWPTGWTISAANNAGLSNGSGGYTGGTPIGSNPVAVASTDFVNYSGTGTAPNWSIVPDFKPASGSPAIDAGTEYFGIASTDIAGAERPNYNGGGAEAIDVGPYEYDHGYGPHPATTTVTFDGVVADSEIRVYTSSGTELAGVELCAENPSLTWPVYAPGSPNNNLVIKVINLAYRIKVFPYQSIAGNQTIPVQMERDTWYSNPA